MNRQSYPKSDMNAVNEHLAQTFYARARFTPLLLGVSGIGFIAIYMLTRFGILGEPAPQLFYIGSITLLFAIAQIPHLALAQQGRGIAANLSATALAGIFAILLAFSWERVAPVALLIAVLPALAALRNGLPRKYTPILVAELALTLIGIWYVDVSAPVARLQNDTPAAAASIVFLLATGLLLSTILLISYMRNFRSIQSLLLTAFIFIVSISTVTTAILSAIGAYSSSQAQTLNTLEAVTTLKLNQMATLLSDSQNDTKTLLADPIFRTQTLKVLAGREADPAVQQSLKRESRARMFEILGDEEEAYNEIMVLDTRGTVVISSDSAREGVQFDEEGFFREGLTKFYAEFPNDDAFGAEDLVIASPVQDANSTRIFGVLLLRSDADPLKQIMQETPGFPGVETYLVDAELAPVTGTKEPAQRINTAAALDAIQHQTTGSKSNYTNYQGERVLGYYAWFAPMRVAAIAEIPLSLVVNNSLRALYGSALLALLVTAVSLAAVVVSARAIADPIKQLAETSQSFADGKLQTRAVVDRQDEIGALALAYNQMAAQLQDMIGKLEQRVGDRTRELESQSHRLRIAALIARDAATVRDLRELLEKTAELICSRFGFYHTGIFLLDQEQEYAILVASPTEAGRKMLANNYRARVGETGSIGRVASTREPRIIRNSGSDSVNFNNPYLPDARSEMALPLQVGGDIIGVLDVQSDQLEIFSDDDVAIMQILADQLAIAIERTRLLQEVELNLQELESAYGRFTQKNWEELSVGSLGSNRGYRFDSIRIEPVAELPELAEAAIKSGTITNSNGTRPGNKAEHRVAVPIRLRGQTIGAVNLTLKEGYDPNTVSIVEQATERLATAMESARLYEEARLRADREQAIARVTTAITASTEYEQILQTTVREIGSILEETEVTIQILEEPMPEARTDREA